MTGDKDGTNVPEGQAGFHTHPAENISDNKSRMHGHLVMITWQFWKK